jgi:hypothetical protein
MNLPPRMAENEVQKVTKKEESANVSNDNSVLDKSTTREFSSNLGASLNPKQL